MKHWTIQISVDDTWVADGFDITNENVKDLIGRFFPYAFGDEYNAKVLKSPTKKEIERLQS